VSGLSSFNNFFKNQTTGCGDVAYSLVGYFVLSHPLDIMKAYPRTKNELSRSKLSKVRVRTRQTDTQTDRRN